MTKLMIFTISTGAKVKCRYRISTGTKVEFKYRILKYKYKNLRNPSCSLL